jgi:hypothetical protein
MNTPGGRPKNLDFEKAMTKPVGRYNKRKPEDASWWGHWWLRSPIFKLDAYGQYTSQPGAEFWYDHFWKCRQFSAWTYELVRRLAKMPRIQNPRLAPSERAMLNDMPPYPLLPAKQKRILYSVFSSQFSEDLVDLEDLHGSELREKEPWKRGQPFKLGDWRQIEVLDFEYNESDKEKRDLAKKYIKRYWPLIRVAWQIMNSTQTDSLGSPFLGMCGSVHDLSGCHFTEKELHEALRESNRTMKRAAQSPLN